SLLQLFDTARELLRFGEQRLLLITLRLGHLLAELLLGGAQRFGLGDRRTARLVCLERRVDQLDGRAAGRLRGTNSIGFVTEQLGIDHQPSLFSPVGRSHDVPYELWRRLSSRQRSC